MSKSLIDRLRRARQTTIPSGERTFTIRRPTDLEMQELVGVIDQRKLLVRFVTDWGVMSELDLGIPGGGPDPVPFDAALWEEWIADHPEHWNAITSAVVDGYRAHKATQEDAEKNSGPGSTA